MMRLPKFVMKNIAQPIPSDNKHNTDNILNLVFSILLCKRLANNATIVHSKAITASTAPFQII